MYSPNITKLNLNSRKSNILEHSRRDFFNGSVLPLKKAVATVIAPAVFTLCRNVTGKETVNWKLVNCNDPSNSPQSRSV